jgi:nitrogen fixation protein FixH
MVIGGLSAVVITNSIMVGIAISHPSTPASVDHWSESLAWDEELAVREHSAALGWSVAGLSRSSDGRTLAVDVIDAKGHALPGLTGAVRLERSDSAAHDLEFELGDAGDGRYLALGELPTSGLYLVTIDVRGQGDERFVTHQRVALDALVATMDMEPQA